MGYYIFSYGIKEQDLKSVFGSNDMELLDNLSASSRMEEYAERTVLEELISGNTTGDHPPHVYGYALLGLCSVLGEDLAHDVEIKLGPVTDGINAALATDFGLPGIAIEEMLLPEDSHSFAIPQMEDWPVIGLLRHGELQRLRERLNAVHITDAELDMMEKNDPEKAFCCNALKGILDSMDFCIEEGLDMISFCH